MDDLVQLGAYVLVILIIGGASVIKKIIEAQKRRKELEKNKVNTLRLDDQPQSIAARTVVSEKEIPPTSEEQVEAIPVGIEDVLRKMFNIPQDKPQQDYIEEIEIQPQPQEPSVKKEQISVTVADKTTPQEIDTKDSAPELASWDDFTDGLNAKGLTEVQRAIIVSDLIRYPVSRRNRVERFSGLNR